MVPTLPSHYHKCWGNKECAEGLEEAQCCSMDRGCSPAAHCVLYFVGHVSRFYLAIGSGRTGFRVGWMPGLQMAWLVRLATEAWHCRVRGGGWQGE